MKTCPRCGVAAPADAFYRSKHQSGGLSSYCKRCCVARGAEWRKKNPARNREHQAKWYAENSRQALRRNAEYRRANAEKVRASAAARWRRLHPEVQRPPSNEARAAAAARKRDRGAAYIKAHPEKALAYGRTWRLENPEAVSAMRHRRRALRQAAPGAGVTTAQWKAVLAESLGLCAYCNERKPLTMDHIEPLSRGGAHDVENIAAVCLPCNSAKHNKPLLVWLALRQRAA